MDKTDVAGSLVPRLSVEKAREVFGGLGMWDDDCEDLIDKLREGDELWLFSCNSPPPSVYGVTVNSQEC